MAKKTIYITETQLSEIKKRHKKKSKPSAMDQVHNKVNSGIMANITCGGMFEGKEEVITLYHGVNPDKLEHNLQIGGFEPRVCSEGGPKAIWLSEKQYGYPFIFKFQIPKKMVSQMTAVDYIYEDAIPFDEFNCELVKTQIFLHVHNSVVEVNLMDERLSKLQFRYFPDLKNFLTKEFENYPLVFETYIKSFIEKYDSAPIDESLVLENSNDKMVNAYIKQLFGIDDFQEVRNKVMDAYKKVPMARAYGDKFLLGVLRYIYEEKIQPKEYPILNYMISQMPYSFRNSFDRNFNGIPYAELKEKLFPKYAETVEPKTDCPKVRQTKNGYIIRRIDSFTEMHYYDAGGNWCIGNQEDMWYELIEYETVYIVENPSLVKKVDAERDKYEEKWDEAAEYDEPGTDFPRQFRDEYALSRFVVISSEKGIFEVYSRYNIPNCHDGSFLSDKELEKLLGIPVREAFPYIPSEEKVEMENLNEGIYDIEDLTNDENLYDCISILEEFLDDKERGIKVKQWNLIPAEQYQNLLRRYMTSPEMARIPYEVVLRWFKDIIVPNAFAINNITMLAGHSSYFPFDDVYDVFNIEDRDYEYHTASKILEDAGFYDWCKLPDGSDGWSDYGLEPLMKIVMEYRANMSAEDILILINRCLDVAHQRGDLASAFIQGGSAACSKISNSLNENPNLEKEAEKEMDEDAEPEANEYHIAAEEDGNLGYFHALNESRDAFIFQGKKYTYQNEDVVTFISMKDNNNKVFVADGNERHEALLSRLMDSGVFGENPNPRLPLGNFHNGFACGCYWKSINVIALFKTPTNRAESENLYNVVEALNEKGLNVNKATLIINYWDNSATRDMFIPYPWFFNGIFETIKDSLISVEPVDESRKYFKVNGKKGTYYTNWAGTEYYTYYELQDKIAKPSINESPHVAWGGDYSSPDALAFITLLCDNKLHVAPRLGMTHIQIIDELVKRGEIEPIDYDNVSYDTFANESKTGRYWINKNLISCYKMPTNKNELINFDLLIEMIEEKAGIKINRGTLYVDFWNGRNSYSKGECIIPYSWLFNGTWDDIKFDVMSVRPIEDDKDAFRVFKLDRQCFICNRKGVMMTFDEYNNKAANVLRESISSEGYNFKKDIKSILKFMRSEGLKVYPFPKIKLNWEDQDGLFIRTGYYEPIEKRVVVFCKDRHPKDILRSICHELIHHVQNLEGKDLNFTSNDDVKDNKRLEKIEAEAYLKGNIYFRKWTEYQHGKEMLQEARKKVVKNDEGKTVPEKCDKCGGDVVVQIHGEPVYICKDCGKYFGTMPFPNNLNESIIDEISPEEVDLSSFNIKKHLNPKFWKDGKLDSRIRLKLLDISDDFIDTLGVSWVKPKDVIITGSLSNFNWNKNFSDIDLHVLMDFKEVDEKTEFVKEYFDAKKKIWNEQHEGLNIYGFPVEVYVQDVNEEHTSSGVYSLDKNEWIVEPKREKLTNAKVNKEYIKEKVAHYVNLIDALEKQFEEAGDDEYKVRKTSERAEKLFKAIKGERTKEFSRGKGEISNGNIVFKCLRRMDYIGILMDIRNKTYDKMASLNQ